MQVPAREFQAGVARISLRWRHGPDGRLLLCAVISNGDFDEYWRYHLDQEHQRLYPGTAQAEYTLSV